MMMHCDKMDWYGGLDYIIEYFNPFACHLMRIGKMNFVLEIADKIVSKSGVANVSEDGRKFMIEIGSDFSIKRLEM